MALAITDLMILEGRNATAPSGWQKISKDLNAGAGGAYLYLAYRRDPNRQNQAITDIMIVDGEDESAPSGWTKLGTDLNKDAGGWYLYLAYRRGSGDPIHDIKIVNNSGQAPGYRIVNRDLNKEADGEDLYIAYDQSTKNLRIGRIFCISASTGYGSLASAVIVGAFGALGAAAGAIAGLPTIGGTPATAVAGAAVGAAAGTLAATMIDGIAEKVGPEFADDVYIKVDGEKVWPRSDKYRKMNQGDIEDVNFTFPFSDQVKISVMEYDLISDDELGENVFTKATSGSDTYIFFNKDEGSMYNMEIFIED